jgi:ABC-2 type transport system permease protein
MQESIMSATTLTLPAIPRPNNLRILLNEMRYEVIRALRTRAYSFSAIGFPVMFYCLFGLIMNRNESVSAGVSVAKYLLGSYAVFGSLGAAIFGIGIGVAMDRNAGWLELKQASPMPPLAYVLAKCAMAVVFSLIIVCALTILGIALGHVSLTFSEFAHIALLAAAGAIPFSCLGLAMAFLAPPASAGGIANMIYLPMSFLSGLWMPLRFLPHILQTIAPIFPTYHLAQLMYAGLGAPSLGSTVGHWLSLLGFTLIMVGLTWLAFRRLEQNS